MKEYKNINHHSSVDAYDYGEDWICVRFFSGIKRTYTYERYGRLNVEAMKRCADEGVGLSSYIYGPFGFRAILQRALCNLPFLKLSCIHRISRKYARYPSVLMKKGIKYKDSAWNGNRSQEKLKPVVFQDTEKIEKKGVYLMLDEKLYNYINGNCQDGEAKGQAVAGNNNSCHMARLLLSAIKSVPETSVPM